jgi:hypothetical protein
MKIRNVFSRLSFPAVLRASGLSVLFLSLALSLWVVAEEGMFWIFHGMDNVPYEALNQTYKHQLEKPLNPQDLRQLSKGVIQLGNLVPLRPNTPRAGLYTKEPNRVFSGFCSGSFVSPQGLVYTNWHCADACVSNLDRNLPGFFRGSHEVYGDDHFYASRQEDEARCDDYAVVQTLDIQDVTQAYLAIENDGQLNPAQKQERMDAILKSCVESHPGANYCAFHVSSSIAKVQVVAQTLYDHVRLAYSPSEEVASLGGDNGNFNPGTRADFAFLRVYEPVVRGAKDEVQPLDASAFFLKSDISGEFADGDVLMVMGYPGSTTRLRESYSVDFHKTHNIPTQIAVLSAYEQGILAEMDRIKQDPGEAGAEQLRRLNAIKLNISNSLMVYVNHRMYFDREGKQLIESRNALDALLKSLTTAPNGQEEWVGRFGGIWEVYERSYRTLGETGFRRAMALVLGGVLNYVDEIEDSAFCSPEGAGAKTALAVAVATRFMDLALSAPQASRLSALEELVQKQGLERSGSRVVDFLAQDPGSAHSDFCQAVASEGIAYHRQFVTALRPVSANRALYSQALTTPGIQEVLAERLGGTHRVPGVLRLRYDDANSTLRFTYGPIASVEEAVFDLAGNTSSFPGIQSFGNLTEVNRQWISSSSFNGGPAALAYLDQAKTVFAETPVNLLAKLDTTGGNSGSPVFGKQYTVVGTLFDGNRHGISQDYDYESIPKGRSVVCTLAFGLKFMNWDTSRDTAHWSPSAFNRIAMEVVMANARDKSEDF